MIAAVIAAVFCLAALFAYLTGPALLVWARGGHYEWSTPSERRRPARHRKVTGRAVRA